MDTEKVINETSVRVTALKQMICGRGTKKAVASLPISACLQNEQANFVALRFVNLDYGQQAALSKFDSRSSIKKKRRT